MIEIRNEQGVIVRFAQTCERAGITIVDIRTEYPDAIVEYKGRQYAVEFEYCSSSFLAHRHDPTKCDLIVCWNHDLNTVLPVIQLSDELWHKNEIVFATKEEKLAESWRLKAVEFETELNALRKSIVQPVTPFMVTSANFPFDPSCVYSGHDVALHLFKIGAMDGINTAQAIGVKDVRTVQARAEKLNGVVHEVTG